MHSPPQPLPSDHGEFDGHYLRVFAGLLPGYFRPRLEGTLHTITDIVEHLGAALIRSAPASGSVSQSLLRERRHLRTHLCYTLAECCVHSHARQERFASTLENVRYDLKRIQRDAQIIIPHEMHPLYGDVRAQSRVSKSDLPIQVIRATKHDQRIAEWMLDAGLQRLLANAPEMSSLSPECGIELFAAEMRENQAFRQQEEEDSATPKVIACLYELLIPTCI